MVFMALVPLIPTSLSPYVVLTFISNSFDALEHSLHYLMN
ncbi:hypothetical protein OIU78_026160 [Salix suchowensis]|nr:hypothetical protein OIU78_026160 [Salix suchowensis]